MIPAVYFSRKRNPGAGQATGAAWVNRQSFSYLNPFLAKHQARDAALVHGEVGYV